MGDSAGEVGFVVSVLIRIRNLGAVLLSEEYGFRAGVGRCAFCEFFFYYGPGLNRQFLM